MGDDNQFSADFGDYMVTDGEGEDDIQDTQGNYESFQNNEDNTSDLVYDILNCDRQQDKAFATCRRCIR